MPGLRYLILTLVSITLFIGGIILLLAKLPFWSYYFGIPSVQIGIVFLILAFERIIRGSFGSRNRDSSGSVGLVG